MHSAVLAAEFIGLLVLVVLAHVENRQVNRDRTSWCFVCCMILCASGMIADAIRNVIFTHYPQMVNSILHSVMCALSYGLVFSFYALVLRYYVHLSNLRSGGKYNVLTFIRVSLFILGAAVFIYTLFIDKDYFNLERISFQSTPVIFIGLVVLFLVVSGTYLVVIRTYVEKGVFASLYTTMFFVMISVFVIVPLTGFNLSYPIYSVALLMVHSLMRDSLVNLSQVEATEAALTRSEELNAMLQMSYTKMEEEHKNLEAVAALFNTMHMFDLEEMTFKEMVSNDRIRGFLNDNIKSSSMQERLWKTILAVIRSDCIDEALAFTNLFDLKKRMNGKSYISIDVTNQMNTSWRLMFIKVGGKSETVKKVLFVTQPLEG